MPTVGDTRLLVNPTTGLNIQDPAPANEATDVDFELAEVSGVIRISEWLETPFPAWWVVEASQTITNIGVLSIAMSGGISMNTPTGVVSDAPHASTATITSTSAEVFAGETEYTWNFNSITLTHNTVTSGSVTRTYSTDAVTFTTGEVIIAPTLDSPADEGTNYYLNKDWLLEMRWADTEGVPIADHTLYFAASGDPEFIPRTDRTRYSIVAYKMFLDVELDYETTYLWFVRKDLGGGEYVDSEIWSFTTAAYAPPQYSTRTRPPYGGGADITVPSGENNMITVERLIAIARNKFFYEDV